MLFKSDQGKTQQELECVCVCLSEWGGGHLCATMSGCHVQTLPLHKSILGVLKDRGDASDHHHPQHPAADCPLNPVTTQT